MTLYIILALALVWTWGMLGRIHNTQKDILELLKKNGDTREQR